MSKTTIRKINDNALVGVVDLDLVTKYVTAQENHLNNLRTESSAHKRTKRDLNRAKGLLKEVDALAEATVTDENRRRWL